MCMKMTASCRSYRNVVSRPRSASRLTGDTELPGDALWGPWRAQTSAASVTPTLLPPLHPRHLAQRELENHLREGGALGQESSFWSGLLSF